MEWIVEAECKEDLVDGYALIGEEFVRCVDCKYAMTYIYQGEPILCCENRHGLDRDVGKDEFCSEAERYGE